MLKQYPLEKNDLRTTPLPSPESCKYGNRVADSPVWIGMQISFRPRKVIHSRFAMLAALAPGVASSYRTAEFHGLSAHYLQALS